MIHTREQEMDYCTLESAPEESLDEFLLGKRLDIYGDYDTGGPEADDFDFESIEDAIPTNMWRVEKEVRERTYGFTSSEDEITNPFEDYADSDEEIESADYFEEQETLFSIYHGLEQEDNEIELLYSPIELNKQKDLLEKIKEMVKQDQEEYEEEPEQEEFEDKDKPKNIVQLPLEQEVKKAA